MNDEPLFKRGIISAVAKEGAKGIKFENEEAWYNPTEEIKDQVKTEFKGKPVEIRLETPGSKIFNSIMVLDSSESLPEPKKEFKSVYGEGARDPEVPKSKTDIDDIPEEYIKELQGKKFITHQGLLWLAHKKGIGSIHTEMLTAALSEVVIFKATVTMKDGGTYVGHGDADKNNVNGNIAVHKIRMAETRAINRALRLAVNCGMTSSDELGGKSE